MQPDATAAPACSTRGRCVAAEAMENLITKLCLGDPLGLGWLAGSSCGGSSKATGVVGNVGLLPYGLQVIVI